LWTAVSSAHELDVLQMVQLTEACRAKDRLDKLDELLRGDVDTWARVVHRTRTEDYELRIDNAASLANSTADHMKKLLNALRLPDENTGRRPQRRGPRGVQQPSQGGARVSSLDRARAAKSGGN
jgi:hypothetical protein